MDGNTIPIGENTTVIVKASGDLFLKGEEQNEVRFQGSEDRIRVNQSNDTLYVETHASMDLDVPRRANVVIEKVGGSAFLQDLDGSLGIQKIGGDLALQRMGTVRIEKVGGGCLVDGVSDTLTVGKVGGDMVVRQLAGSLELGNCGGDGDLQVLGLGPLEARAGGDLHVYFTTHVEGNVSLRAGGDIHLYIPASINARFNINSSGETIDLNLNRQGNRAVQTLKTRHYEFTLGEGGVLVEVLAGGDIYIGDEEAEPESITDELENREAAWRESRERRGNPSWSAGFGFDRSSAWAEMVSRRAQEAARRAEQRSQAAMRRTEDQIRQAAERQIRQSVEQSFRDDFSPFGMPPTPPEPPRPAPASEPVTDQERKLILEMLRDNKITVEQADKLLAALEGHYSD